MNCDYLLFNAAEKKSAEKVLAGAELAPAQSLWTTEASGSVQLRIDELCPEQPITVHQMFTNSVQKYGKLTALATKRGNEWEKVTFSEYYHLSRMAAKSFLKVILESFLNTDFMFMLQSLFAQLILISHMHGISGLDIIQ